MTGSLRHGVGAMIAAYTTLTNTSVTTVLTGDKGGMIVNEIQVSNVSGGSVTVSVDIYDGTNVLFEFKNEITLADDAVMKIDIDGLPLFDPRLLRVIGANTVKVMVIYYRPVYESSKISATRGSIGLGVSGEGVSSGGGVR